MLNATCKWKCNVFIVTIWSVKILDKWNTWLEKKDCLWKTDTKSNAKEQKTKEHSNSEQEYLQWVQDREILELNCLRQDRSNVLDEEPIKYDAEIWLEQREHHVTLIYFDINNILME